MKNKGQLLNKGLWLDYLNRAQEGGLTINAMANDIVAKFNEVIGNETTELKCPPESDLDKGVDVPKKYYYLDEGDLIMRGDWFYDYDDGNRWKPVGEPGVPFEESPFDPDWHYEMRREI